MPVIPQRLLFSEPLYTFWGFWTVKLCMCQQPRRRHTEATREVILWKENQLICRSEAQAWSAQHASTYSPDLNDPYAILPLLLYFCVATNSFNFKCNSQGQFEFSRCTSSSYKKPTQRPVGKEGRLKGVLLVLETVMGKICKWESITQIEVKPDLLSSSNPAAVRFSSLHCWW